MFNAELSSVSQFRISKSKSNALDSFFTLFRGARCPCFAIKIMVQDKLLPIVKLTSSYDISFSFFSIGAGKELLLYQQYTTRF